MGESACVMQSFSHLSDTGHQAKEDNPMHALGESISFGRFMTESLAWERWSSFNENRYLEEVERFSKPGSVAQKKAYFEAHYKKKAAALLEQASDTANNEFLDDGSHNGRVMDCVMDSESFESDSHVTDDKPGEAAIFTVEEDLSCAATKCNSNGGSVDTETNAVEEVLVLEKQVDVEYSGKIESPNLHENVENKTVIEVETIKQFEELPLKEIRAINQESAVSETIVKASTTKTRSTSSSKVSVQNRASKLPSSPARAKTPGHSRKENNSTPSGNKIAKDLTDKRRLTPKSIHMSLSLTPSPSRAGETNKIAQIVQKAKDSRVSVSSAMTPKDCPKTPLRTPAKASANSEPKLRPVTPQSESRRTKPSLQHTAHGSRKVDLKSQSLSIDSKPSSAAGNNVSKAWPSSVSSSFSFRSEERAAKRKEYLQRLEEKSNAREAQKMELQAKSKEKAEAELRKMRQTLGFKAKPMPDFNHEMPSTPTKIKKLPLTRPRSPKLGRRPNSSTGLETKSLPPKSPCPSVKSDSVRHGMDKRSRPPSRPATSQSKKNPHENASPNLQS